MKKIIDFLRAHPLTANIIYMFIVACVIFTAALYFLDYWTQHGTQKTVPSLKGMTSSEACRQLQAQSFQAEIADSIYDTTAAPGTVVEQSPRPGSNVKPGRTVYLTVVAFTPKMVTVPHFHNTSMRQGISLFEAIGIKKINVVEIESEYKGLVLGAKFNGVPLKAGTRIPGNAAITIEVGRGYEPEADTDALDLSDDSILNELD